MTHHHTVVFLSMFSGDSCISSIFLFLCRLLHCVTCVLSSANSDDPTHSPHERTPTRSQQSQVRGRRILSTPPNFESKCKYRQGHACHSNIATLYRTTSGDSPAVICVIPSKCLLRYSDLHVSVPLVVRFLTPQVFIDYFIHCTITYSSCTCIYYRTRSCKPPGVA